MIYNAYQDTDKGIAEISVVSSGHIFAHQNRRIHRPNGRADFLLLFFSDPMKSKAIFKKKAE